MKTRSMVSIATLAVASAALLTGCPESGGDKKPGGKKPATTGAAVTSKPATTGTGATKPTGGGSEEKFGKGVIEATVKFTGEAPEMKVPKKRSEAEFCKDEEVKFNAVVVNDGMLKDVFVGLEDGQVEGDYEAEKPATLDQKSCMYEPRILGLMPEQEIIIKNSDPTLHNVNASLGATTLFNTAQPKGAPDLTKSFEEIGNYKFKCDVHPWMRAFGVTVDNPFHAISGEDGKAKIEKLPAGKYKLMAWHSQYGKKTQEVEVKDGKVEVNFEYDGTEEAPAENKGELDDLF